VTGLTHDERGYPQATDLKVHDDLVRRLCDKIRLNAKDIMITEDFELEDAEILVVCYGAPSRSAKRAVRDARKEGIKVGMLRLVTIWPFPEERIAELGRRIPNILVPEVNYGQIVYEVERCAKGSEVKLLPKLGGEMHTPDLILEAIREVTRK